MSHCLSMLSSHAKARGQGETRDLQACKVAVRRVKKKGFALVKATLLGWLIWSLLLSSEQVHFKDVSFRKIALQNGESFIAGAIALKTNYITKLQTPEKFCVRVLFNLTQKVESRVVKSHHRHMSG